MATANGTTSPDEFDSLADLVAYLRGQRPQAGELGTIMKAIDARDVSARVEERVRVVAATLLGGSHPSSLSGGPLRQGGLRDPRRRSRVEPRRRGPH